MFRDRNRRTEFTASGRPLSAWAVINFTDAPGHVIKKTVTALVNKLRDLGVQVPNAQPQVYQGSRDPYLVKQMMEQAGREAFIASGRKTKPQLFLCFMDVSSSSSQFLNALCLSLNCRTFVDIRSQTRASTMPSSARPPCSSRRP